MRQSKHLTAIHYPTSKCTPIQFHLVAFERTKTFRRFTYDGIRCWMLGELHYTFGILLIIVVSFLIDLDYRV